MTKLNLSGVSAIIDKGERNKLLIFSFFRIFANGLDLVGIAGIALLATAFGSFAGGGGRAVSIELPLIGSVVIREYEAVLIALLVAGVFVSKSIFSVILNLKTSLFVAGIESRLSNVLARDFFGITRDQSLKQASVSDFQNAALVSVGGIKNFINARILFLSEGSLLVSLIAVFVAVNPVAAVSLASFMGAVLVGLNHIVNKLLKAAGDRQISGSRKSLETARDLHGVKREVQLAGLLESWLAQFDAARKTMANSGAVMYTLNTLPRFVIETSLILGMFLFIGGIVIFSDVPTQAVTIGVFLAGGLRLMASIIPFQGSITGMRGGAATGRLAFELIQSIGANNTEVGGSESPKKVASPATLSFRNVDFSYPSAASTTLKNISIEIKPFTRTAIVGPSGSGKSTLFGLAMGFLTPNEGRVLVGNRIATDVLRDSPGWFALVPQKPNLITGTISENVSLVPQAETDLKLVKEVLARAGLARLTTKFGWETQHLTPDATELSGGEIQRLSLARALYRKPQVLFMDEATSALDAQTELEVTKVIEELRESMTVVLIAHRLSTVRKADNIIYLENGTVVAEGTFSELRSKVAGFQQAVEILGLND